MYYHSASLMSCVKTTPPRVTGAVLLGVLHHLRRVLFDGIMKAFYNPKVLKEGNAHDDADICWRIKIDDEDPQ
jgi:hypothetical protein